MGHLPVWSAQQNGLQWSAIGHLFGWVSPAGACLVRSSYDRMVLQSGDLGIRFRWGVRTHMALGPIEGYLD